MSADPNAIQGHLYRLEDTRAELSDLLQRRDMMIRQLAAWGVPITTIAKSAGLSRTHVYRILDAGRETPPIDPLVAQLAEANGVDLRTVLDYSREDTRVSRWRTEMGQHYESTDPQGSMDREVSQRVSSIVTFELSEPHPGAKAVRDSGQGPVYMLELHHLSPWQPV